MRLLFRKALGSLEPVDDIGTVALQKIAFGNIVTCEIRQPRNIYHHRLFFAMVNMVYQNQDRYDTADQVLTVIKIGIGHADTLVMPSGTIVYQPKSISFANMDQTEFNRFFDLAVDFVCKRIIPSLDNAELTQRVFELIGSEDAPKQDTERRA